MIKYIQRVFYKKYPPSLCDARRAVDMLHPGCRLVRYVLYSDGCHTRGMATPENLYFEGYGGVKHAPHLSFVPNDKPVYEWGVSGLKYGEKIIVSTT